MNLFLNDDLCVKNRHHYPFPTGLLILIKMCEKQSAHQTKAGIVFKSIANKFCVNIGIAIGLYESDTANAFSP